MNDPMVDMMATIRTEMVQGIILPEQIRTFIHPVVAPTLYRSPDDIAEAEAIRRLRDEQRSTE